MDHKMVSDTLDKWADIEAGSAAKAKSDGDERMHSIFLMKESMYRTMLKVLAIKAPAKLSRTAEEMDARADKLTANGDIDGADRCRIQKACIERVIELISGTGETA